MERASSRRHLVRAHGAALAMELLRPVRTVFARAANLGHDRDADGARRSKLTTMA